MKVCVRDRIVLSPYLKDSGMRLFGWIGLLAAHIQSNRLRGVDRLLK